MMSSPQQDPEHRRALRVLRIVHELHKRGYQKLRIGPGMSGSGYWRCAVTHLGNIFRIHGAKIKDFDDAAKYTSAQENSYFDWQDAKTDTVEQLADKFLERFPDLCRKGLGDDWEYAGWYVRMLGFAECGQLPVAYADWMGEEPDSCWLPTIETMQSGLPMPPGGLADLDDDEN